MNRELAKSIGGAARTARKALQLTQEDAAERINVSVEFYARIERGTSLPSIATFARIVSALGVSADTLLGREPAPAPAVPASSWMIPPPSDSPEIRRLLRRLRKARASTLRLVSMLTKELERADASNEEKVPGMVAETSMESAESTAMDHPAAAAAK
ncbi:MAG: helix-turn-helix domain-containing protein [Proteobacteria bacterium]|nr:helix-turn-helix domain-containing protein [Pseudomonadota bacterium]